MYCGSGVGLKFAPDTGQLLHIYLKRNKSWFLGNFHKRVNKKDRNKNKPFVTKIKNITVVVFSEFVLKVRYSCQISVFLANDKLIMASININAYNTGN